MLARDKLRFTALLASGFLLVGVGQYVFWWTVDAEKTGSVARRQVIEPDFFVKETKFQPLPEDKDGQRLIRVFLVNRLDRPVAILGSGKGCQPWGCCEVLNLPKEVAAGEGFWLRIQAKWIKPPDEPLTLRLFTNLALKATVDLEVLPDSVTIQTKKAP